MWIKKQPTIHRKTLLRGAGVSMALPWMPIMAESKEAVKTSPARMAFAFMPNGIHADHWTPKKEGLDYDLPKTLKPLGQLKKLLYSDQSMEQK